MMAAQDLDQGTKTVAVQSALPGLALVVVFVSRTPCRSGLSLATSRMASRYELAQAAICAMIAKWPSSCNS
jgi:hypothetical protein